jgi:hypothetical protein
MFKLIFEPKFISEVLNKAMRNREDLFNKAMRNVGDS